MLTLLAEFLNDASEAVRDLNSPRKLSKSGLDYLVERIENRHTKKTSVDPHPPEAGKQDGEIPLRQLFLQTQDWCLWRLKCAVCSLLYIWDITVLNISLAYERIFHSLRADDEAFHLIR